MSTDKTVAEVIEAKQELEDKIADFLYDQVTKFLIDNGVSVKYINLDFRQLNFFGRPPEFLIDSVTIELNI